MQTQSIAALRAQLETTATHLATLGATGERYDAKGNPQEIADKLWTETSLEILAAKPKSLADIVLQLKTLVERQEYPNAGTDEDTAAVFHRNALAFLESN